MFFLRLLIVASLLRALACLASAPAPLSRIAVVFLAGQSNADGRAPASALPAELRAPRSDVLLYSHLHGESAKPDGTLGRLGPLAPGRTQFPANSFGPEIGLGHTLATRLALISPGTTLAIVKYAKGGSSLQNDWRSGGDATASGDGPHYFVFQRVARDALATLRIQNPDASITPIGLVWIQGETDADTDAAAASYGANLAAFLNDVRSTLHDPSLPLVVARLSDNQLALITPEEGRLLRHQQVRKAQTRFSETSTRIQMVDTDGPEFTFLPDRLHFDAAGQLALGTACADALAKF